MSFKYQEGGGHVFYQPLFVHKAQYDTRVIREAANIRYRKKRTNFRQKAAAKKPLMVFFATPSAEVDPFSFFFLWENMAIKSVRVTSLFVVCTEARISWLLQAKRARQRFNYAITFVYLRYYWKYTSMVHILKSQNLQGGCLFKYDKVIKILYIVQ